MRMYNPALSRFFMVDPLVKQYPWYTPYQFAGNMPIQCIDLDGLEPVEVAFYIATRRPLPFIGPTEWYTMKGKVYDETYHNAFMWNTRYGETQAYENIKSRHEWYAYAHKIVNDRGAGNYWFQAAEKVTGWWAVGAADNLNMWFMSDETESVMRGANEFLLGENMRNFGPYIFGEGPIQWVNKEKGYVLESFSHLSGLELDNQMVVIEMTSLQGWLDEFKMNYIAKNGQDKWDNLHNNINKLFASDFLKSAASAIGADNAASNYAQSEFKKKFGENTTFDFMNLDHRIFQGQKMAEYLRNNDNSQNKTKETTED